MAKTKYVYFFGNGDADGDESMRADLGGKGANLAQMAKAPLSLPVPPGFTITTDVCQEYYKLGRKYPAGLEGPNGEVAKYLAKLEKVMGKKKDLPPRLATPASLGTPTAALSRCSAT